MFIEPTEDARSISVLDVQGIGMKDVGGEVLDFIKGAAGFAGQHYPERCGHIYIVNVPTWFSWVWNLIKPMIDPVTRAKTHIVRGKSQVTAALAEHIEMDQLPAEYGGTCTTKLGDAVEELMLKQQVSRSNGGEGPFPLLEGKGLLLEKIDAITGYYKGTGGQRAHQPSAVKAKK